MPTFEDTMLCSSEEFQQKYGCWELWHEEHPDISKFKDTSVLMLGAGPSAIGYTVDINKYDYIFSCNNIHLSPFRYLPIAVHYVSREVKLDENFLKHVRTNKALCIFETSFLTDRKKDYYIFKEKYNSCILALSRHHSRIGSLPKLILYAIFFGVKQIDILGMDGAAPDTKLRDVVNHAFEGKKVAKGPQGHQFYIDHFNMFWEYVFEYLKPKTQFRNLSEHYEHNVLRKIDERYKRHFLCSTG